MARFDDVARERTDLSDADLEHLRALVGDWTLLSDLAFADLVLWLPTWHGGGFVAADQVRPTTGPTVVPDDVVGQYAPRGRRPYLDRALVTARVVAEREHPADRAWLPARQEAIPVRRAGRTIAVLVRHSDLSERVGAGVLESAYLAAADELVAMVVDGTFPPAELIGRTGTPPRVGDGLIRVDAEGTVVFASPNARSAYHRLGLASDLEGSALAAVTARLARRPGPVDESLATVTAGRTGGGAEIANDRAVVTLRGVPLRRGAVRTGALVLVRDATEIRRRDRALVGKDATIREIHHRVKNNLQTVAALLRLQERRLESPEARAALEEAVRRVGAIAVVHEALSYAPGQEVDADDVLDRLVSLLRDMTSGSEGLVVERVGGLGMLPSDLVTPLAMALGELLQNAVEHGSQHVVAAGGESTAGEEGPGTPARVVVSASRTGDELEVCIADEGPGLPAGSDPFTSGRLGLQIVRTLVTEELGGRLELGPNPGGGTLARVLVPAPRRGTTRVRT